MSLPVKSNIVTLDIVKDGQPWCKVPAKNSILTGTLDIVYNGQPWAVNADASDLYTRGNYEDLPATDANLETGYSVDDITNVGSDNTVRVGQLASGEYAIHQFKQTVTGTSVDITWNGQSDLAPSTSPVVLEVYNYDTPGWEELDRDSTTAADTDFDLQELGFVPGTDYLSSGVMTCRVYQNYTV